MIRHCLIAAQILAASMIAEARTEYGQDRVDGLPVVERLDINDLAPGVTHRFYFRAGRMSTGQGWYIPVLVSKGAKPGRTLALTAAVHGDELNGIAVIHKLLAEIDPRRLNGTIIAIPGVNLPGLLQGSRNFGGPSGYGATENLNRIMPGDRDGETASRYAARIWDGLLRNPVNLAIDLHTQSRGTAYPLYVFADTREPDVKQIALSLAPDIIKIDKGVTGSMETTWNNNGVPAVTYEIGEPDRFQNDYVNRAVDGLKRVLVQFRMAPGPGPAATAQPFIGNETLTIPVNRGGLMTLTVRLGQAVNEGQLLAEVRDPVGRVVERITAPWAGRVLAIATNPLRDPGTMAVRLIRWNADPACGDGC